jgi:hypothetical protein
MPPSLSLDSRGDPSALLYETQKVAVLKMLRQSPGNLHRLANTLSTVSACHECNKEGSAVERKVPYIRPFQAKEGSILQVGKI